MKHKVTGLLLVIVAGFYVFTNPTGAAATVKTVVHAAGAFLGALTR